jgi:acyl carrier protein
MDIRDRVISIIAEQAVLDVKDVTMDSTLESWASTALVWSSRSLPSKRLSTSRCPSTPTIRGKSDFDISSVAAIIAAVEGLVARTEGLMRRVWHHRGGHDQRPGA